MSDTPPDWMTDEWLRNWLRHDQEGCVRAMACEILRLRAELARASQDLGTATFNGLGAVARADREAARVDRLRGILVECVNRGTAGGCKDTSSDEFLALLPAELEAQRDHLRARAKNAEAERDALRAAIARITDENLEGGREIAAITAEILRLRAEVDAMETITERIADITTELGRPQGHDIVGWLHGVVAERDAAIRDRHEFAASEVERLARDYWDKESALWSMDVESADVARADHYDADAEAERDAARAEVERLRTAAERAGGAS